jgi:Protein of unknown function (DUF5674)
LLAVASGELHADCEQVLLEDGSEQAHVWGADWYPLKQSVGDESLINIHTSLELATELVELQRQLSRWKLH